MQRCQAILLKTKTLTAISTKKIHKKLGTLLQKSIVLIMIRGVDHAKKLSDTGNHLILSDKNLKNLSMTLNLCA